MPAFDFPNNPSVGTIYAPAGGPVYTWNGVTWMVTSVAAVGMPTADSRNRIVNGAMRISQENGGTASSAVTSLNYYPADQWLAAWNVAGASIQAVQTGGNVINLSTVTGASPATASYCSLNQRIEGLRVADLNWGAAGAVPIVVRFSAIHTAGGTFAFSAQNAASDRSYLAPFTLAANTWTNFVLAIPGDTTGTWAKDNTVGLACQWQIGGGSSFTGVAGWQAGNKNNLPGSTNGVVTGSTFSLANVGLYLDPQATGLAPPWQEPDYASELLACQRYYAKTFGSAVNPAQAAGVNGALLATSYATGGAGATWFLPVSMRALPTVTSYNPSDATPTWRDVTNGLDRTFALGVASTGSISACASGTAATAAYNYVHMVANARM